MAKNPILNAALALGYIVVVSGIMFFGSDFIPKEDTVLAPITMLSLLTLSASVMAYLFMYEPLQLFLEGKKKQALDFFFKTVGVFAVFTIILLVLLISGIGAK